MIALGLFMTAYWLWRCRDICIANEKKIVWADAVYWLLAATGIVIFYLLLMTHPFLVMGTQLIVGLFIMSSVKKINWQWFLGLLYFTLCGVITMIMSLLLSHYDVEYAKHM